MALEIRQQLRQTQQLAMTPQLQQAIKLLQYNHLEMVEAVESELLENPVLEALSHDDPLTDNDTDGRSDLVALEELVKEPQRSDDDIFNVDWENYLESYGGDFQRAQKDPGDHLSVENFASRPSNLFHHLLEQLRESHLEGDDRRIALEIIGNVDEKGFLDVGLEELASQIGFSVGDVEHVLTEVQKFEPTGVIARDLRECLLIQARVLDPSDEVVIRILEDAYGFLETGKLDLVARKLKLSSNEVRQAARVIASLDPRPGLRHSNTNTVYVVPDIFVIKIGDEYSVVLNDEGLPRLRMSAYYQRELHSQNCSTITKDYIHEKMRGAMWFIKSIHQRQRTIYKVTLSIIRFQRDFFDKGIDYLKPLILKDVADDIEMHESTVSRVTTNKYVHTPRGIFELKYFFNSGIRHGDDAIASESVKNHILRIIRNENPDKPASDKQIVDELALSRTHIARRTVAKYRELLGIPPSSRRKKKF